MSTPTLGAITFKSFATQGYPGDVNQLVQSGAVGTISAGSPVTKALGQPYVLAAVTNTPVVGTDYVAGVASTLSTDTASADGAVKVLPLIPGTIYLMAPKVAATFGQGTTPSQSTYNALVGARVLWDLTTNVYTILAADGSTHGLVVEPLDVTLFPGLVAFSIRLGASYLA